MPKISRRSGNVTFIEKDLDDKKISYCRLCEERTGQLQKLVPRLTSDGLKDDKFKLCPFCGDIVPIFEAKIEPQYVPKGHIPSNPYESGTKVVASRNRRTIRNAHSDLEPIEIPKFGKQEDTELEAILKKDSRPAILNMLEDSVVDDYEGDY